MPTISTYIKKEISASNHINQKLNIASSKPMRSKTKITSDENDKITKQIALVNRVIDIITNDYKDSGICCILLRQMFYMDYIDVHTLTYNEDSVKDATVYIRKEFSWFNIDNATYLAEKYNFTKPSKNFSGYWWYKGNKQSRLEFLNAIVKELNLILNLSK